MHCRSALVAIAAGLALSSAAFAQNSSIDIGGWTLSDVGHKLGDDSDRRVSLRKEIPEVEMIYQPSEANTGGSIQATFRGCRGLNLSSGFDLPDAPAARAAEVRNQIHEAFTDFAKSCPVKSNAEATLLAGFDQAFAAIDKLMREHPNVYPPEPSDPDPNSKDQSPI